MISHLLDTCVYSQRLRPKPLVGVMDRWRNLGDESLAISGICEAELRYGLARKNSVVARVSRLPREPAGHSARGLTGCGHLWRDQSRNPR